jgi:hypothetical protein
LAAVRGRSLPQRSSTMLGLHNGSVSSTDESVLTSAIFGATIQYMVKIG